MEQYSMSKIEWQTDTQITVGSIQIPYDSKVTAGYNQGAGLKKNSKVKLMIKSLIWPTFKLRNDLLIDGFIEKEIGKLINKYIEQTSTFLEIGCGNMSLSRFITPPIWYNALDLELSEFHIIRQLTKKAHMNVVIASATDIPSDSNVASLIVSTETFEHIPAIDEAIQEIRRVARKDALLICSIPNNYCHKYQKKGPHKGHINNWTYQEFINYMHQQQFELIEGFMKGAWIPLPLCLTHTSYQIPFSPSAEYYNTNFFYVFRVKK